MSQSYPDMVRWLDRYGFVRESKTEGLESWVKESGITFMLRKQSVESTERDAPYFPYGVRATLVPTIDLRDVYPSF